MLQLHGSGGHCRAQIRTLGVEVEWGLELGDSGRVGSRHLPGVQVLQGVIVIENVGKVCGSSCGTYWISGSCFRFHFVDSEGALKTLFFFECC